MDQTRTTATCESRLSGGRRRCCREMSQDRPNAGDVSASVNTLLTDNTDAGNLHILSAGTPGPRPPVWDSRGGADGEGVAIPTDEGGHSADLLASAGKSPNIDPFAASREDTADKDKEQAQGSISQARSDEISAPVQSLKPSTQRTLRTENIGTADAILCPSLNGAKLPALQGATLSGPLRDIGVQGPLPPLQNRDDRISGSAFGDGLLDSTADKHHTALQDDAASDGHSVPNPDAEQHPPETAPRGEDHVRSITVPTSPPQFSSPVGNDMPCSKDGELPSQLVVNTNTVRRPTNLTVAALTATAVTKIKTYRRSSAALHKNLLRAFVPDVLINVSLFG